MRRKDREKKMEENQRAKDKKGEARDLKLSLWVDPEFVEKGKQAAKTPHVWEGRSLLKREGTESRKMRGKKK